MSNLRVTEEVKLDSTDEKYASSDEKAIIYFMEIVDWFKKADIDFLKHLYNMEKAFYEKGLKMVVRF